VKAAYRPLRRYRTRLAPRHSPIQGVPAGVHNVVGGFVSFFVSFAANVWPARSEHATNRGTHSPFARSASWLRRYQTEAVSWLGGSTVRIKTPRIQGTI